MAPGPSGTASRADYGCYHESESWPANAANPLHRVDFRRSWVPSPDMPPATLADASLSGIEEDEGELPPPPRPSLAAPRRARTRSSRTYGGEENQNQSQNQNQNQNQNVNAKRPVSASTSSSTSTSIIAAGKRPLRPTTTAAATAAHYADANASAHLGDEPPITRTSTRQAGARPCARPRPPAREQERDQGQEWQLSGEGDRCSRRSSWLSVLSPKKLFSARKRRSGVTVEASNATSAGSHLPQNANANSNSSAASNVLGRAHGQKQREVHPAEWRAYGMWARPRLGKEYGEIIVRNATPVDSPRELSPPQVDAMLASLWEDGRPNADRWIPRVRHWSLPPRPDLWPTPRQAHDPLPEELQLNPFLVHRLVGRPPIHFDLRMRAEDITLGERPPEPRGATPYTRARARAGAENGRNDNVLSLPANGTSDSSSSSRDDVVPFWCDGPNGAQPATYPGVPRLRITALAGDAQHEFPWPVTVLPHHEALPVLVADVVNALIANFEERLSAADVDAVSDGRRTMVYQAYWRRMRLAVGGRTPPEDDGLRRVDYLGDAVYFRGLEPNPSGDGFMLFLGPPP